MLILFTDKMQTQSKNDSPTKSDPMNGSFAGKLSEPVLKYIMIGDAGLQAQFRLMF